MDNSDYVKTLELENQRLMATQGVLVMETNRKCELYCKEIKKVSDENRALKALVGELKSLCYFLDDDRQKTKKLSKEWQDFAQNASHMMKKEIEKNNEKVDELEKCMDSLIKENEMLKTISGIHLDVRRSVDESCPKQPIARSLVNDLPESNVESNETSNEEDRSQEIYDRSGKIVDYIKGLERRIQQLERDRMITSTSAPNLTTFHSPTVSDDGCQSDYDNFNGNEMWSSDEICVSVGEPDSSSGNDGTLSPIVEEAEFDKSLS